MDAVAQPVADDEEKQEAPFPDLAPAPAPAFNEKAVGQPAAPAPQPAAQPAAESGERNRRFGE